MARSPKRPKQPDGAETRREPDLVERWADVDEAAAEKYGIKLPIHLPGELLYDFLDMEKQIQRLWEKGGNIGSARWGEKIPDSVVNRFAVLFLSCYVHANNDSELRCFIPQQLVHLLSRQLALSGYGLSTSRRPDALDRARKFVKANPKASNPEIVRDAGVDRATVRRWFISGKLRRDD